MRKTLSFVVITLLYMGPLAVFAQKAKAAPQTKIGRLEIRVSSITEWNAKIDKKRGDNSTNGVYSVKSTADYKYSGTNKAVRRAGNVSTDASKAESTRGRFTYEYDGTLVERSSKGSVTTILDKGSFAGEISEVGTGSVTMSGLGDGIQEMEISAFADVRGYYLKTIKTDGRALADRTCSSATFAMVVPEISQTEPDKSMSPERACAGKMRHSANVYRDLTPGYWSPLKVEGSFAAGSYQFSFTGSLFPAAYQKNEPGDVQTFKETLNVQGIWLLAAGSGNKPGMAENRNGLDFETALPERKYTLFSNLSV